jgi:hypothetical protein
VLLQPLESYYRIMDGNASLLLRSVLVMVKGVAFQFSSAICAASSKSKALLLEKSSHEILDEMVVPWAPFQRTFQKSIQILFNDGQICLRDQLLNAVLMGSWYFRYPSREVVTNYTATHLCYCSDLDFMNVLKKTLNNRTDTS